MRTFVIYSSTASTAPVIKDLKNAGRIDVLLHGIIAALFTSHTFRDDVEIVLFLMGQPNPPRRIRMRFDPENTISKKDLKKLIEMALKKCKPGQTREVHPGVEVDDMALETYLTALEETTPVYLLDGTGTHIKEFTGDGLMDGVFVLGDHDGFEKTLRKRLKKRLVRLSLGPQIYFTSQAITIINYELDNRGDIS